MEGQPIETLSVGVYSGLEAEYQVRSGVVYVRDPEDPERRCTQVSLTRWSRFLISVKAGEFTPQQEGDLITVVIGDQSHAAASPLPSFVMTNRRTWRLFVKGVKRGEFDHLSDQRAEN
ncbi:hypothetical protein [Sphaerimonospora thailandensis]|uniref:DUF397 domain-containing protein n=1 Tax=Sphaerimonospora thailandensis TaxID=795644 RepID=A0A8J3R4N8_9ACTN|nr:hypothetical protein [Sphaerimonospora thailandensis]GIH68380.1 hypothetical protein Mth01_06330 [Sphaerimonospora thailandensis]